jgi:hypothetical protein
VNRGRRWDRPRGSNGLGKVAQPQSELFLLRVIGVGSITRDKNALCKRFQSLGSKPPFVAYVLGHEHPLYKLFG